MTDSAGRPDETGGRRVAIVRLFLGGPAAFWGCPECPCAFGPPTIPEHAVRQANEHDAEYHVREAS